MLTRFSTVPRKCYPWIAVLLLCLQVSRAEAAQEILVAAHDDVEISVIRYGVNTAIAWDSPELIDKLSALLN